MKPSNIIIVIAALAITASAGYLTGRHLQPPVVEYKVVDKEAPVVSSASSDTDKAQIEILSRKLADATKRVEEMEEYLNAEKAPAAAAPEAVADNAAPPRNFGRMTDEELARLQTEDPERYAQEIAAREERDARRAEFLENRRQSEEQRDNFFAGLNMDRMNRDERAQLESFVADYQSLRSIMDNGGRNAEGEQVEPMQMMQLGMSVATRADEVRKSVLRSYGREIGFNRRESEQFADKINEVYDATSLLGPGGAGNITRMIGNRAGGGGGGFNLPIGGGNAGGGAGGFGAGRQRGGNRGGGN